MSIPLTTSRLLLLCCATAVLLLAGCQDRAETVRQQLLGSWSVVGADDFHVTTTGQRYTFDDDGTFTIRERRGLGASGALRAAYEVARDGTVTFRDGTGARTYTPVFSGDTLRLAIAGEADGTLTLTRASGNP
jgi:hypothetical protein